VFGATFCLQFQVLFFRSPKEFVSPSERST
jgi:hypothetical protein